MRKMLLLNFCTQKLFWVQTNSIKVYLIIKVFIMKWNIPVRRQFNIIKIESNLHFDSKYMTTFENIEMTRLDIFNWLKDYNIIFMQISTSKKMFLFIVIFWKDIYLSTLLYCWHVFNWVRKRPIRYIVYSWSYCVFL